MDTEKKSQESASSDNSGHAPVELVESKLLDNQVIQIQFRIDDLMEKLKISAAEGTMVLSCGGCSGCTTHVD